MFFKRLISSQVFFDGVVALFARTSIWVRACRPRQMGFEMGAIAACQASIDYDE